MTTGRSNSAASDTRNSVSWKVERAPNKGRNCLGWTSREAGHSRVPAPPHMISGIIRVAIGASNLVVVAIPGDEIANAILDGGLRPEADVAHEIADIGEGFNNVSGLHRQHILYRRTTHRLLQHRHHMGNLFRMMVTDIIDARRHLRRAHVTLRNLVQQAQYYAGHVIDMGKVATHLAMVKKPDRRALDDRLGKEKDRHVGPAPRPINGKETQACDRKP